MTVRFAAARFWSRVDKAGGSTACWPWTGARSSKRPGRNHGMLSIGGRSVVASRVAWELARGAIPEGLCVLHRCDNPPCCNPGHLYLGTNADNVADRCARRRGGGWRIAGENHVEAKLTEDAVLHMRSEYAGGTVSFRELGRRHGVTSQAARYAVTGRTWSHLTGAVAALPMSLRPHVDAHWLEMGGERLTIVQWSKRLGIPKSTIGGRLRRGWSVERALTTPPGPNGAKTTSSVAATL
jgi:hypothetical protein